MEIVRIVGQGRLSELLKNSPMTVAIDTVMRDLAMYEDATASIATTSPETLQYLESYASGVNDYLAAMDAGKPGTKRPVEFLLAGEKRCKARIRERVDYAQDRKSTRLNYSHK